MGPDVDICDDMLPLRDRPDMSEEAVKARWRSSGIDGAEAAAVTFARAVVVSLALA